LLKCVIHFYILQEQIMQKMISKIAPTFPYVIWMGFIIVILSVIIGFVNSQTAAAYFTESKAIRETTLLAERAAIESTILWLPYFKFLGLGMVLGGIVMALKVILDNLMQAGMKVIANLPEDKRPAMPKAPWYGRLMPIVMMLGMLIFIVALIVSLQLSGTARAVYANPIPVIDAAGTGTVLLAQLQSIQATSAWLVPFKFLGIATEFLAIVMGLGTIVYVLNNQTAMLKKGVQVARSGKQQAAQPAEEADQVPATESIPT
jgi:hypothetical protein